MHGTTMTGSMHGTNKISTNAKGACASFFSYFFMHLSLHKKRLWLHIIQCIHHIDLFENTNAAWVDATHPFVPEVSFGVFFSDIGINLLDDCPSKLVETPFACASAHKLVKLILDSSSMFSKMHLHILITHG